jgi:RHS repeat-associated protein
MRYRLYAFPKTGGGYNLEYYLKDHLFSNRIIFADMNVNGSINAATEILEENTYYPYGLEQSGLMNTISSNASPYQYSGKEMLAFNGYNMNDYGARYYDAALGRWNVMDELSEKYHSFSCYNFVVNNPMKYIDPDGKEVWINSFSEDGVKYRYESGKVYDTKGNEVYQSTIKDEFVLQTILALGDASKGDTYGLISAFAESKDENIDIKYKDNVSSYDPKTISFDPYNGILWKENGETKTQTASLGILHEFGHAIIDQFKNELENFFSEKELEQFKINSPSEREKYSGDGDPGEHKFILRVIEDAAIPLMQNNNSRKRYVPLGVSIPDFESPVSNTIAKESKLLKKKKK